MLTINRSTWSSRIAFAFVAAWAAAVAIVFDGLRSEAMFGLAFPILLGVVSMLVGGVFDWLAGRPLRPLAYFNFSVAVVLAFLSIGIMHQVIHLFGRQ